MSELERMAMEAQRIIRENFVTAHRRVADWEPTLVEGLAQMPEYKDDCAVADLQPGYIWMQADDEVRITAVQLFTDEHEVERVRVYGRIIKGWGAGTNKVRTWVWPLSQTLNVRR